MNSEKNESRTFILSILKIKSVNFNRSIKIIKIKEFKINKILLTENQKISSVDFDISVKLMIPSIFRKKHYYFSYHTIMTQKWKLSLSLWVCNILLTWISLQKGIQKLDISIFM